MEQFDAELIKTEGIDAGFIIVPFDVAALYGAKRVKVQATFDGYPYRGSIVRMGGPDYIIGITKEIRESIKKTFGDKIHVTIEKDESERVVELSDEFQKAISADKEASAFWMSLSYSNQRKYAQYVDGSKKEETRLAHLKTAIEKLRQHVKL
ncbi:MAG: DUF1905 domain-containing protein [Lachnospiraceae bacterium]